VFKKSEEWEEDRFGLADREDVKGWGMTLQGCGDYYATDLELRLAHRFQKMTMQVGQGNDSHSYDQLLVVEVYDGTEQVEIQRIPFDTVTPFDISAVGVNAMIVRLYIDDESQKCSSDASVIAVVEGLTLT
jgi:hypothetical protein